MERHGAARVIFRGLTCAALLFLMATGSFSYNFGASPMPDYVRMLVSDTQQFGPDGVTPIYVFADQEITAFSQIVSGVWQSSQFYSGTAGVATLPSSPVNYYRIAAAMLFALAANKARLSSIKKILDVTLDPSDAAIQLRATAQSYIDMDDNSGAFVIIEMVNDAASFRDRFWKQIQRQSAC